MSHWTVTELEQMRRRLKAAVTHANKACCSQAVFVAELELLRIRVREALTRVERLLDAERKCLNQRRDDAAEERTS